MEENGRQFEFLTLVDPVLERLQSAGYEAYLVGGCVRDALLARRGFDAAGAEDGPGAVGFDAGAKGRPEAVAFADLDVTTNALPEEVACVFSDWPVIETGVAHGTVTVLMPAEEIGTEASGAPVEGSGAPEARPRPKRIPVEITTYRCDGAYSDGRHPDQVRFVSSLEEDLARRDFTVNAMAMDREGRIADPFGGQQDLADGLLRAVGDPEKRFREDGLRILRALRFAAVLDFALAERTGEALRSRKELLRSVSAERIFAEWKKMLRGRAAGRILREYVDVLAVTAPELLPMKDFAQHNPYHRYDVLEHCIRAMENVKVTGDDRDYMRLAALFHDVGKPETYSMDEEGVGHFYGHPAVSEAICRRLLTRFRADRFTLERVCLLVKHHDLVFREDERLLKRWMNRFGPEVLLEILEIKRADNVATGNASGELLGRFERIDGMIRDIAAADECFRLEDLAIGGRELLAEGFTEGPEIGRMLEALLDGVIDGRLPNERNALLAAARRSGEGGAGGGGKPEV